MVININFHDRTLEFKSHGKYAFRGEGLNELLAKVAKYGKMIDRVEIKGQSKSYTFTRQVYLFANILSLISISQVTVCGKPIRDKMLFPVYPVREGLANPVGGNCEATVVSNGAYDNKI